MHSEEASVKENFGSKAANYWNPWDKTEWDSWHLLCKDQECDASLCIIEQFGELHPVWIVCDCGTWVHCFCIGGKDLDPLYMQ